MTDTALAAATPARGGPPPSGAPASAAASAADRGGEPPAAGRDGFLSRTIEEVAQIEQQGRGDVTLSDRLAERISSFSGSMTFVLLHVLWFGAWMIVGLGLIPGLPGDDYPFQLLTMVVSLEAIFLSAFVMITQNRQSRQADRRARLALQVEVIGEREITKMMGLVYEIHDHLGLRHAHDHELDEMQRKTSVEDLATAVEEIEAREDTADSGNEKDA